MTPQAFRAQVASGATDPVYVIVGDDEHEKSALALALGEMVEEDLRAFNVERMYAVDSAVTPDRGRRGGAHAADDGPASRRDRPAGREAVRPQEEAQGRRCRSSDDDETAGSLEPLVDYLTDPSPTTALAFVFSSPEGAKGAADIPLAKNLKVTKTLLKAATIVVCTGLDGGQGSGAVGSSSRPQRRD